MELVPEIVDQKILLSPHSKVSCTHCGREDAPVYYLRRSRGRYALLCFQGGSGCWENSAKPMCQHQDANRMDCTQLAEWEVIYGIDGTATCQVCSDHLGAMMGDVAEHRVCPLED